jgi:hypothetical protein
MADSGGFGPRPLAARPEAFHGRPTQVPVTPVLVQYVCPTCREVHCGDPDHERPRIPTEFTSRIQHPPGTTFGPYPTVEEQEAERLAIKAAIEAAAQRGLPWADDSARQLMALNARAIDARRQIDHARVDMERSREIARRREPTDSADAQNESLACEVLELRSAIDRLAYALEIALLEAPGGG